MNISMQYFLVVAEELSISRAAERLYVSQQCVSSHIKKLEQQYCVELFVRKPAFCLTEEGKALQRSLLRQKVLESSLAKEMNEIRGQRTNRVRAGIHNTRAGLLLPLVIRQFQKSFPNVVVEVYQGSTNEFETMLLNGNLDIFIATDTMERPEFRCLFLRKEHNYLVSTVSLLERLGMGSVAVSHKIEAVQLTRLPFISSLSGSYLQTKIDSWMDERRITIQKNIVVGTYRTQLLLEQQHAGVCFCPQMLFPLIADLNRNASGKDHLVPITVEGLDIPTELSVIVHRDAYQSEILSAFSASLKQAISTALGADVATWSLTRIEESKTDPVDT